MRGKDAESTEKSGRRAWLRLALAGACAAAGAVLAVAAGPPVRAQDSSRPIKPADAVRSQVYVSLEPVPRGKRFEIAVVGEVAAGYHVQANKVLEDYLIPLTLTPELPPGVSVVSSHYPRALLKKFPFAAKPMAVYEGKVTVRLTLEAAADAPLGPVRIPMTLRFQACNDQLCLPPVKAPLNAELTVAPAGTPAKNIHTDVFAVPQ